MGKSVDITISLVSYNQCHDLERLLPTLLDAAKFVCLEVLLVDCHSSDGTLQFVHERFPEIDVFVNLERAGYGENHNINLERATGRYFVIMNSDMMVGQDTFTVLLEFIDKHDDIGIVSPKIINEDGTVQSLNKRYPAITDLFIRRFFPHFFSQFPIMRRRLDYYEMRDVGYDHIYDVPCLSGCFMFCRTDLLMKLKGFDQKYFLYFEDFDLCRRIQETHRTVYNPQTSVIHFWKRDAHINWVFTYYFMRSAFRYFNHWGYKFL